MDFNSFNQKFVINGKKCHERKKQFYDMCKDFNVNNISLFNAVMIKKNPALGCLYSHLNLIKKAKKEKMNNILIFEDDCLLTSSTFFNIPDNWDMLYFGGNVKGLNEEYNKNKQWIKANMATTHCYCINHNMYDILIDIIQNNKDMAVDVIYSDLIHPNYNCYILNHMIAHQRPCYSIIEGKYVSYNLRNPEYYDIIKEIDHEINDNYEYIIKGSFISDDKLPKVSILTPTYNRRKFFKLAINNFNNFVYPKNKLEWIIIDDGDENIQDLLPNDKRIKYIKIKLKNSTRLNISKKRNLCVKYASNDILVHMDDDDYYPPFSVISRVKSLLLNNVGLVGCTKLCCYSLKDNKGYLIGANYTMGEATFCYTRDFFNERKFNKKIIRGEGLHFIRNRKNNIRHLPYNFVMIVINHSNNLSGNVREINIEKYKNYLISNENEEILSNDILSLIN